MHQAPPVGRTNPLFTEPPDEQHPSEKLGTSHNTPPPYQEHPDAGSCAPGPNAKPLAHVNQLYGPPGGPQEPVYTSQPYPVMSAAPGELSGHPGVAGQRRPTIIMTRRPVIGTPVPDYLWYSIFTMLFCCLPLGICAVVFSIHTRNANAAGQHYLAFRNSRMALRLSNLAVSIGLMIMIIAGVLIFLGGSWDFRNSHDND